jgi:acetyl-CoA carboxylase carboxyltransferase component
MMDIINRLVDNSEFEAYKDGYGQTIITGYARIDGWAVGIVANQRKVVKPRKAKCNLEVLSTLMVLTKRLIANTKKFL